jgi:hypothetical protein
MDKGLYLFYGFVPLVFIIKKIIIFYLFTPHPFLGRQLGLGPIVK